MHMFHSSWRRSLAAAALVPLFRVFSGDGISQEPKNEVQRAIVKDNDSPASR